MDIPDFFLLCLAVGFIFSLISALGGAAAHLPHLHLPHLHLGGSHGIAHGHGTSGLSGGAKGGRGVSAILSPPTIAGFLMWFGASGFILTRFADWRFLLVIIAATGFGILGGGVVFWFMARLLIQSEKPLDPADYDMTGVLGRLSSSLRPSGTGEMIFAQDGRRCGVAVRSENGSALERGTEVVVTRCEGGIAYVRTWDEMQRL